MNLKELHTEIKKHASKSHADSLGTWYTVGQERYHMGVSTPLLRKIARKYYSEIRKLDVDEILNYSNSIVGKKCDEYRIIAFQWAEQSRKRIEPRHFELFEKWLRTYVKNWATCDDLCCHSLGFIFLDYPELVLKTKKWRTDKNWCVRRASAVALIPSLRRGKQLDQAIQVSLILMDAPEDLVQKAYGWMLKEATKKFPQEVYEFVMKHKKQMSRTALRYAIEKLPKEMKKKAMS
jgi:3-methyladenine DNA glycosylase AlkD